MIFSNRSFEYFVIPYGLDLSSHVTLKFQYSPCITHYNLPHYDLIFRRNKEQYEAELKELAETEQATLRRYQDAQARIRQTEDKCMSPL